MRQNVASQVIGAQMVSATDGSAFTGSVTVYVTVDGGTQAVGTVGSGAATHEGQGFHTYAPSQAETNGAHVAFTFTGTGAVPATVQVYTDFPQTGDSFARIGATGSGLTTLATAAALATVDSNVDAILVDTGTTLPASLATIDSNVDAILVDTGTTIPGTLSDMSGATFDTATDSLEAIRNRGDAAWTTGAGGSNPLVLQNTTIATLASQTSFTLTAGSADNDAYNGSIIVFTDQSTSTQKAVGVVTDYVGSTRTVTLLAAPAFTIATGDTVDVITGTNAIAVSGAAPQTAADIRAEIDSNSTQLAAIVEDTGTTLPGLLTTIDTVVDRIEVDTQDLQTQIGTDGAGLTAIPWNASWDAEVQSECNDALVALHLDHLLAATYDPASKPGAADALLNELVENDGGVARFTVNALENGPSGTGASAETIADAVWDEVLSGHTTAGTTGAALNTAASASGLDAAGVRAAVGLASANLDTQLSTIDSNVDAVLVDTGTTIPGTITTLQTSVDAVPTNAELTTALDSTVTALATAALSGTEGVDEQVTINLPGGGTVVRDVTRAARTNPITATEAP